MNLSDINSLIFYILLKIKCWRKETLRFFLNKTLLYFLNIKISFTLYPMHSMVGRGNLALRHSDFHRILEALRVKWRKSTPLFCLDTRSKKWKYKFKLIFHFLEWGSNPHPVAFQVYFVPLRHDWQTLKWSCKY